MNETVELLKAERNFWKLKWHEVHAELRKANRGLRRLRAGKEALAKQPALGHAPDVKA